MNEVYVEVTFEYICFMFGFATISSKKLSTVLKVFSLERPWGGGVNAAYYGLEFVMKDIYRSSLDRVFLQEF